MEGRKKVLLVSYDFPPIGGGGIQRNVKFLKYLSRLDWDTFVLTVKERDYYVYDYSLLEEIKSTTIYKASSIDPVSLSSRLKKKFSNNKNKNTSIESKAKSGVKEGAWYVSLYRFLRDWFMFPDGYGGWIPFAYRKGSEVIKKIKPDILFATFPHPSNALITYYLAKRHKLPFVIDFRDPWVDDMYVNFPSFIHRRLHMYFEKKITQSAAKVIVYGEPLKQTFLKKYPGLTGKIEVITNGFDPEDFLKLTPNKRESDKKRIVYSGAVYVDRRETYKVFLESLSLLDASVRKEIEVIFVGDKLQWAIEMVDMYNLNNIVKFTGYLVHEEALGYLASADVALMFLKKGDKHALTGKIFEYLGLGLPIIACVEPDGACSLLLKSLDHDQGVASPSNPLEIKTVLMNFFNGALKNLNPEKAQFFSRKYHTEVLDKILRDVLK